MTTRTLLILRHAKAMQPTGGMQDFDRPLAPRGREDSTRIGTMMASRGWLPNRVFVSPAKRTAETWTLVSAALGGGPATAFVDQMYNASDALLLRIVRERSDAAASTVLIVAHNPGVEDLAAGLAGPASDQTPLSAATSKFPPGGLARLSFDGEWSALTAGSARLTDFVTPAELG